MSNQELFAHVCTQMDLLARKKISVDDAKAQAGLAKQANNLLRYELDRAKAEARLHEYNTRNKTEFSIRDIESTEQI